MKANNDIKTITTGQVYNEYDEFIQRVGIGSVKKSQKSGHVTQIKLSHE